MSRKTIEVSELLIEANRMLALDTISQKEKKGICFLLEFVLHETDRYNGFYINYWLWVGCQEWHGAGEPDFPEKNIFINGPDDENGRGEYNRCYFGK